MDKIQKALKKLSPRERRRLKFILLKIERGDLGGLDLKKLKGRDDIFRIRKGDLRVILRKDGDSVKILTLERRGSKTYRRH